MKKIKKALISVSNKKNLKLLLTGLDKYKIIDKRGAISWLTTNSNDFKSICHYADIDSEYALTKFTQAMKLDIYILTDMQNKVIQNKPQKPHTLTDKFRLTFND